MSHPVRKIYTALYDCYGPQGWWPLMDVKGHNLTKSDSMQGYHPQNFDYPKTDSQRFEIAIGAILTQNTNWTNVEKALHNLYQQGALSLDGIDSLSDEQLKDLIRPAGYFNQKAKKIRCFCEFVKSMDDEPPERDQLLAIWGIGPETADSILLYAWQQPVFIVDAYTRRIFSGLHLVSAEDNYDDIQRLFTQALPADWQLFQEYHALLVEHAKRFYSKKPWGKVMTDSGEECLCFLKEMYAE